MDQGGIEPRAAMIAVAEVFWEEPTGTPLRAPARMEDTSASGACIRVKTPLRVGSKLTVKWHREQFSGAVRNCRSDEKGFLLGILRDQPRGGMQARPPADGDGFAQPATQALVEVSWKDLSGTVQHAPAIIKSRSDSETCLSLNIPVPARRALQVSWREKPFSGTVKYCRWEGKAYLVGIQQEAAKSSVQPGLAADARTSPRVSSPAKVPAPEKQQADQNEPSVPSSPEPVPLSAASATATDRCAASSASGSKNHPQSSPSPAFNPEPPAKSQTSSSSLPRHERKIMRTTKLFSGLWGHPKGDPGVPDNGKLTEAPVNKMQATPAESVAAPQGDLLSCEDIYHASGILGTRSGYGINKIVDMLNSKHIRELPKDVKRASVLMALDAAGAAVDEVMQDATRRQHALDSYENGRLQQFEQFETRIARENAHLQAELERVRAHYAERIKQNLDQVSQEKDALRDWQNMKQQECQRITEAVELCAKPGAHEAPNDALSVAAASRASAGSA